MRKCHYTSNHDQPISQETEFRRHFGAKEQKDLRYTVEFSRNSSQVVMGYDTEEDKKEKYKTTYKNYIHESASSINHNIEKAKQERTRRDATTEFMRKSSVELGTEKHPPLSTTQIDFRPVKF
ncbi:hypothetical protein C9374_004207 [Naegleria lovaniensis]|uniref:Uncharacterized protein n=1 Tax=Naegleria lovaniensis TaxID=51637 RepID=A0AA88GM29_NAELO|nr:uncharacterized protein C9374_004207 [Naegleria lovaniensis]KAG2383536.1 hypothetical protein C9374_004207 [Naegleria lovaniensis]